jgi:hypothetical protein
MHQEIKPLDIVSVIQIRGEPPQTSEVLAVDRGVVVDVTDSHAQVWDVTNNHTVGSWRNSEWFPIFSKRSWIEVKGHARVDPRTA